MGNNYPITSICPVIGSKYGFTTSKCVCPNLSSPIAELLICTSGIASIALWE